MSGEFEIGRFLKEGWGIFKNAASSLIVAAIVYFVVYIAANIIPVVNFFAGFLLPGAMFGGMYYIILDTMEGREFSSSRIFDGFRLEFLNLTLIYVLTSVFVMLAMFIPMFIGGVFMWFTSGPVDFENPDEIASLMTNLAAFMVPAIILAALVSAWYMFAYLFVADKKLGFWEAMEASRNIGFDNHFKVFLFLVILGVINMAGAMALGVGLLVSFPYSMCVITSAYKNLAGEAAPAGKPAAEPPPLPSEKEQAPQEKPPVGQPGSYAHCFVFIEGPAPSEKDMLNIIKAGAPHALERGGKPVITGHGVEFWPLNDDELKSLIKEAMEGYRQSNPEAPRYTDSSLFKIKVWKGRDAATKTNMALASVLVK